MSVELSEFSLIYFRSYVVHVPLTRNAQTSDRLVEVQWSILENATALGLRIPPHPVLLHVNNTPVKLKIIGASLSEPHLDELAGAFLWYIYITSRNASIVGRALTMRG